MTKPANTTFSNRWRHWLSGGTLFLIPILAVAILGTGSFRFLTTGVCQGAVLDQNSFAPLTPPTPAPVPSQAATSRDADAEPVVRLEVWENTGGRITAPPR